MPHLDMKLDKEKRSHLIEILSHVLDELSKQPLHTGVYDADCSCFNSIQPPPIKLKCYLKRIAKFTGCSEESLIFSLIYIDRLIISGNSRFIVTSLNVHRMLLASVLVAVKFYDDQYFNNKFFSKVGGISVDELNVLETEFLFLINFNLFVDVDLYELYHKRLMCCVVTPSDLERVCITEVAKEFPLKSEPSLPDKRRYRQRAAVNKGAVFDSERSETSSPSEDTRIHRQFQGLRVKSLVKSPRKRCSNVALFLRNHKISRQDAPKPLIGNV